MNFALSEEQEALRAEARRFLADRVDRRAAINLPGAHDPMLWKELASAGWLGLLIPESFGGQGSSTVDTALVFEETGRALLPGPYASTVLASLVIDRAGSDEQRARLLPPIARGDTICAARDACAGVADLLLFTDDVPLLLSRAAWSAEPLASADLTRPGYSIAVLNDGERLGAENAWRVAARVLEAAEATGAAAGALDMAVAYAKNREQFDKPIGSFQAIKHKAADMFRAVETARITMMYAAWCVDAGSPDADAAATTARALASDALLLCAKENIQIHGGIGVTWEHDAHLYYRRALAVAGHATAARDDIASAVFDGTALQERA